MECGRSSLVYFRTESIVTVATSVIVIDIINISDTQKLLKCIHVDHDLLTDFSTGKNGLSLFTNTTNQNIMTNTSGDINVGTVVSITPSVSTRGLITTDSLGRATGYFVIPCYTNGVKVPTGDAEFRITQG
jgi:hypothetical protein